MRGGPTPRRLDKLESAATGDVLPDADAAPPAESTARAAMIERYLPFARMLAAKTYAARTLLEHAFDDYYQLATLGLIDAVDRFDESRGVPFEAYAGRRITGAILNGIRTLSEKQQQISVRQELLRERRQSIITGAFTGNKPGELLDSLAEMAIGLALGFALEDSGVYTPDQKVVREGPYEHLELKQLRARLRALVQSLPQAESLVIAQHYFHFKSFADIALELGVTRGRVSQLHRQSIDALRAALRQQRRPLDTHM